MSQSNQLLQSPPSPALSFSSSASSSDADTSQEEIRTPPDEAIEAFPSTCLPSTYSDWVDYDEGTYGRTDIDKSSTLDRLEKSMEQDLQALRDIIKARIIPDGQISSKVLRDPCCFKDPELEEKMTEKHKILDEIKIRRAEIQ